MKNLKKKNLVTNADIKTFSFVDPMKTRRLKKILSMNTMNGSTNRNISKKELIANDWGTISYTTFICFYYVEEFANNKKECYKARAKYIFQLMSNGEEITAGIDQELEKLEEELKKQKKLQEEIKEILKEKEKDLVAANEWYITRKTFKRFIYKYGLPFQFDKEAIEEFFLEHPGHIKFEEFEVLVK